MFFKQLPTKESSLSYFFGCGTKGKSMAVDVVAGDEEWYIEEAKKAGVSINYVIGIYRFWRDLGYGIGALGLGIAAHFSGSVEAAFWFVAVSMLLSGGVLWLFGEETHPRINPQSAGAQT
ncbi:MAG: hypothetical protein WCZ98_03675 [Sideroxydans sp.]